MIQVFEPVVIVSGEFSPNIASVEQYGYVDLRVAYANASVPSTLEGVEGSFNGIDDPKSILGMPDDVFSAMRAAKAVGDVAKSPEGGEDA